MREQLINYVASRRIWIPAKVGGKRSQSDDMEVDVVQPEGLGKKGLGD